MNFDVNFAITNFPEALAGIPTTLLIVAVSGAIGLPAAFFIALARNKKIPVLTTLLTLFISFMRGTPMVVQIFLVYNIAPLVLKSLTAAAGITDFDIYSVNPLFYAFLVYALNNSASYSEMWRSGLNSLDKGQYEAAAMTGLNTVQTYIYIIIPQAFAVTVPSFCSTTTTMLKNTSLVFIMTVLDITARAKISASQQYKYIEGYVDIFITYLIVCGILQLLFKLLEKKVTAYRNARSVPAADENRLIPSKRKAGRTI